MRKAKNLFAIFRQGDNEIVFACVARWEGYLNGLAVLERHCLALKEEVEHLSCRSWSSRHKLIKWEGERERPRTLQRLEASRATGLRSSRQFLLLVRAHPSDPDEAMSASSQMGKDADEAWSESSWTALAKGKERGWWSIDLEGEMDRD